MNKNGYKIMHIGNGTDSVYGNIYIIQANPVKSNGFSRFLSVTIDNDTESFFYPY